MSDKLLIQSFEHHHHRRRRCRRQYQHQHHQSSLLLLLVGFPNYDAANILAKVNRPRRVHRLHRAYAVSYDENPE